MSLYSLANNTEFYKSVNSCSVDGFFEFNGSLDSIIKKEAEEKEKEKEEEEEEEKEKEKEEKEKEEKEKEEKEKEKEEICSFCKSL